MHSAVGIAKYYTVDPPNTATLGETAVKGVIYSQEKTLYSRLENQQRYWGEAVNGGPGVVLGDRGRGQLYKYCT